MTKLEQLIKELCPNGVEYKKLGDIATDIFRGAGITRNQVTEEGTPCVRYGEIYTTYGIYFDTCVSHTDESTIQSKKYFEHGDILFAITGESVEDIAKSTAYVGHEKCLAGGDIVVLKHNQNPKYLSYVLSTTSAQAQKSKGKVKSKVVHSSVPAIKDIVIPVPPIEVQAEIIKILDEYTESVTALQQELEAELTARKKQYEYYRDLLLDFGVHGGGTSECEWRTISGLGSWTGGCTPSMNKSKYWDNGTIPWISSKDMKFATLSDTEDHITDLAIKETSIKLLPKNITAIVARSGILKHTLPVVYIPFETTVNQDIKALIPSEDVLPRYAYFVLAGFSKRILKSTKKQGGTVDSLDMNAFMRYPVPVPTIEKQERIISILERFDKLCNDISEGLPAEIEARRKQYEYYRDKLLSFKSVKGD